MKLKELKTKVFGEWENHHFLKNALLQAENFKPEVKVFGDLRKKETWEKAYIKFRSESLRNGYLDSWELLTIHLNFKPTDWDYEYRHQIFDAFLMHPDALELIKSGLEQLFSSDFTQQEREDAHGFFELAEWKSARRGDIGNSDEFIRRLAAAGTN